MWPTFLHFLSLLTVPDTDLKTKVAEDDSDSEDEVDEVTGLELVSGLGMMLTSFLP